MSVKQAQKMLELAIQHYNNRNWVACRKCMTQALGYLKQADSGDQGVRLDMDEARRIAGSLEMLYHYTKESAYDETDTDAALDAIEIRDRAGIEPNPDLLEDQTE